LILSDFLFVTDTPVPDLPLWLPASRPRVFSD